MSSWRANSQIYRLNYTTSRVTEIQCTLLHVACFKIHFNIILLPLRKRRHCTQAFHHRYPAVWRNTWHYQRQVLSVVEFWIISLTTSLHSLPKCTNKGKSVCTSCTTVFDGLTKFRLTESDVVEANISLERVDSLNDARKT